ncbi:MAG: hypothetical protein KJ574_00610 [Nanoarchaeota archaeon]|nr:hypothetical protein [Nanoarchaeota archaeon]
MSFFQKNINLFLMLIIVVSVVAYAGSTIYYQDMFQSITSESSGIKTKYSTCQAELDNTLGQLSRTQEVLNSTESDIAKYDVLYENKSTELATTQTTLTATQTSLSSYTNLYAQEKKRADDLNVEVTRVTNLKNQLTTENNALRLQVADLQADIDDLQDELDSCNCTG